MTIPHEDLIRAVLDGKTVQRYFGKWVNYECDDADQRREVIRAMLDTDVVNWRIKPEPRCVWTEIDLHGCRGVGATQKREVKNEWKGTILRHEFDPDTGEYLRTVKEEA